MVGTDGDNDRYIDINVRVVDGDETAWGGDTDSGDVASRGNDDDENNWDGAVECDGALRIIHIVG